MKKKTPWLDLSNKFHIYSCKNVEAYIQHQTGVSAQVHKTDRYLVINFVFKGELKTAKIDLPGGVLYCLSEENFQPLWDQMKS